MTKNVATDIRTVSGVPRASVGKIARPPVVPIDIGSNGIPGNYVHGVTQIPLGFRDEAYAGGLAVTFKYGGDATDWDGDPVDSTGNSYIGLHHRAASSRMGAGWQVVEGSYLPGSGWAYIAGQRRGEYLYVVTTGQNIAGNIETAFAARCPTVSYSETRHWQVCPIFENDGQSSLTFGAVHSMWQSGYPNFTMHISDHEQPRIWFLQGHQCMYLNDTGDPWAFQYKTEPSILLDDESKFKPSYSYLWQMPAYFQAYYNRPEFLLPALVFPWSAGDYGTPEMWWFEKEKAGSRYTGRLTVYRSRWHKGYARRRAGLSRSSHNGIDMSMNADRYAFDHFWYKGVNIIGTIGPFPGLNFNTRDVSGFVPRVIRSTRTTNVLEFAFITSSSTLMDGWDGVWTAHSEDDGLHWSFPRQVSPGAAGDQHTVIGPPASGTLDVAMDSYGGLWSAIYMSRKGQEVQALANWGRGVGVGTVNSRNQNWRRDQGPQWL